MFEGARRDVPAPKPAGVPVPQRSDGPGPLPWRIVKAAVAFMGMMSLMVHTHLRDFLQNDTADGWEMFCSPESWLTAAGRAEGLRMSRINLHQGFDLYKPKAYELLKKKKYQTERPKRIWISARCTYWCPWTSLKYRTEQQQADLASKRRRERAMFKLLIPFILDLAAEDPDLELLWEWPTRCFGWQEPWLLRLEKLLQDQGRSWPRARTDGCRYGLRSATGGFIQNLGLLPQHPKSSITSTRRRLAQGVMNMSEYKDWRLSARHFIPGACVAPLPRHGDLSSIQNDFHNDFMLL